MPAWDYCVPLLCHFSSVILLSLTGWFQTLGGPHREWHDALIPHSQLDLAAQHSHRSQMEQHLLDSRGREHFPCCQGNWEMVHIYIVLWRQFQSLLAQHISAKEYQPVALAMLGHTACRGDSSLWARGVLPHRQLLLSIPKVAHSSRPSHDRQRVTCIASPTSWRTKGTKHLCLPWRAARTRDNCTFSAQQKREELSLAALTTQHVSRPPCASSLYFQSAEKQAMAFSLGEKGQAVLTSQINWAY